MTDYRQHAIRARNGDPPRQHLSEPSYSHHPVEDLEPEREPEIPDEILNRLVAERFGRVLFWLADARTVVQVGQRTYAMLYTVLPDAIDGRALEKLGAESGVTRQAIDKHVTDFRDTFGGIQGKLMRGEETRRRCQVAQLNRQ